MKKYIISIVFLVIAIICSVAYNLSPNYVAEDGTLVESFGFIPLAYLFFFLAIVSALIIFVYLKIKKLKKTS